MSMLKRQLQLDQADEESQAIYEEALKCGSIDYRSVTVLLNGVAGSGKTSVKELLFNRRPSAVRHSTSLADAPIRATCCVRLDATGDVWIEMGDDGEDQHLASEMATVPPTESVPAFDSDLSPISRSTEVDGKYVRLIASSTRQKKPREVDTIFLMDSGGQPQFTDILPLFVALPRVMIFVTNLSDTLNDRPMIGYYENGKPLADPQPSPLSHLEVLQHSVQALQSQAHAQGPHEDHALGFTQTSRLAQASPSAQASATAHSSTTGPAIIVVGTHKDMESRFLETQAEKDEKLISLLSPVFREQLVHYGQSATKVIFPVNAISRGPDDQMVAREIRKAVELAASSIKKKPIPIRWHVLERAMKHEARRLGRPFLTRDECLRLARSRHITEEELDVALDHLTRLNVIAYFHDALPNIIFVQTQALLDKLSELVYRYYQLQSNPDSQEAFFGEWLKFKQKGLVSLQLLGKFPKHYGKGFTPSDLAQLLLHRLVIAQVGDDEYFMPFILPHMPEEDLEKHRVQPSSPAAPLVITFPPGVVPSGLFPALTASLLSSESSYPLGALELFPSSTNQRFPECVYRNCVKFRIPNVPGSLTLIDSVTHIEAHMDAPPAVCSKHCLLVKRAIVSNLIAACSTLKFNLSPQASVLCESTVSHGEPSSRPFWHIVRVLWGKQSGRVRHRAELSLDTNTWTCPLAPAQVHGELQERQLLWFLPGASEASRSLSGGDFHKVHKQLYPARAKWHSVGLALGVDINDLDNIDGEDNDEKLKKMVRKWLTQGRRRTWQSIIDALEDNTVKREDVAESIRKYITLCG